MYLKISIKNRITIAPFSLQFMPMHLDIVIILYLKKENNHISEQHSELIFEIEQNANLIHSSL